MNQDINAYLWAVLFSSDARSIVEASYGSTTCIELTVILCRKSSVLCVQGVDLKFLLEAQVRNLSVAFCSLHHKRLEVQDLFNAMKKENDSKSRRKQHY